MRVLVDAWQFFNLWYFPPNFGMIKLLQFGHVLAEARVGTPEKRGVSGGQRFGSSGLSTSTWVTFHPGHS